MIPQYRTLKLKLPKYRMKKSPIPQYRKPPCPPQSTTVTSPPYKKEAGVGERAGRGNRFGDNEITNMTSIIQRSMNTTTLFEYIMADSIFGTKPATTSRAMGRLIDLFGTLNVVPNSNRSLG